MSNNAKPSWMPTFEEILDAMNAHDNEQPGSPHLEALISRAALDARIELLANLRSGATVMGLWSGNGVSISEIDDRLAALRAEREALP